MASSQSSLKLPRQRLRNRPLTPTEQQLLALEAKRSALNLATQVARSILSEWYQSAADRAHKQLPLMQLNENRQLLQASHEPRSRMCINHPFIMLKSMFGEAKPVLLYYDHPPNHQRGSMTHAQLHTQVRCHLQLTAKDSLRMVPYRPWYNYTTTGMVVPEHRALPRDNTCCKRVLGTTVLYTTYVHLTETAPVGLLHPYQPTQ
jgi:hypothetical protein